MEHLITNLSTKKGMIEVWEVQERHARYFVVTLNSEKGAKSRVCRTDNEFSKILDFAQGMYFAIEIIGNNLEY